MNKDFNYYLALPIHSMKSSNMLVSMDLDNEMRLGLYYLMEIYHLGFHHCIRGDWEWISLSQGEDGEYLSGDAILEMEPDMEKYNKHKSDFEKGIMPPGYKGDSAYDTPRYPGEHALSTPEFQYTGKFGWLSPTGEFTSSDWGEHEGSAYDIICEKGFEDDYIKWEDEDDIIHLARDYLCKVKGYVLIHNPSMSGGYIVTNIKPLTKKQKEFLYDYFIAVGNILKAEHYLND